MGEFYIIDRKSGQLVYRWGNPAVYGAGRRPTFADDGDQQLFGPHAPVWTSPARILLFDNGYLRPMGLRSRALEVDMDTGNIVWEWMSQSHNSFASGSQSNAQRLPNGNTLIVSCESGHIFEVTPGAAETYGTTFVHAPPAYRVDQPDGLAPSEVVWEFINPMTAGGARPLLSKGTESCYPQTTNAIHRAFRYGKDYPGLRDKSFAPRPFVPEYPHGPWKQWMAMEKASS